MFRVAVLASGNGSNLQALLDRIVSGDVHARVSLVLSDKPDAGALGRARRARVATVVALPPEPAEKKADYDLRLLEVLRGEAPDLVVLAGYMRIVGPAILQAFRGRIINVHPSLLPAFRGLDAVGQAHRAGVAEVGCTTHLVTSDLDGGPILLQARTKVRAGETVESLRKRVLALEHLVLPRTVQLFAEGGILSLAEGGVVVRARTSWLAPPIAGLVAGATYSEGF